MKLFHVDLESIEKMTFDEFVKELFNKLNSSKIKYSLIGYYALSHYSTNFRRSANLDLLFHHNDVEKALKFFEKNYPDIPLKKVNGSQYVSNVTGLFHLKHLKKVNESQYVSNLPNNDAGMKDLNTLLGSSDEVYDMLNFGGETVNLFGARIVIPTGELLGILILMGLFYGTDEEFRNGKIEDFKYLSKSKRFSMRKFMEIIKSSYKDLLEVIDERGNLKVESTDKRKYYTWSKVQELRKAAWRIKGGNPPSHWHNL